MGSSMDIIIRGQVSIYLPDQGSRRMSLNDMAPGEYFGEVALFDDLPHTASAAATTDVMLLELSRTALVNLFALTGWLGASHLAGRGGLGALRSVPIRGSSICCWPCWLACGDHSLS